MLIARYLENCYLIYSTNTIHASCKGVCNQYIPYYVLLAEDSKNISSSNYDSNIC